MKVRVSQKKAWKKNNKTSGFMIILTVTVNDIFKLGCIVLKMEKKKRNGFTFHFTHAQPTSNDPHVDPA
jgi:hypothetical protein